MADLLRPRLRPITTHHTRNASTNSVESDSSDSSPTPLDDDTDFLMHSNDSSSTVGALTVIRDCEMDVDVEQVHRTSPIQKLPAELLINIFSKLTTTGDLRSSMLVCYHWALYTVNILWHRPICSKWSNLSSVARTLSDKQPSFPYHEMVKRLNLSGIADKVNDGTVQAFASCKAIERLTLTACSRLSDSGLIGLVRGTRKLQALDVTDLDSLTDHSMLSVARNCPKLQGLNITNCSNITDDSLLEIAHNCTQLKRLKLNGVVKATDESIVAVAENCRSILEIDLASCAAISSASVTAILSNLTHLRELRLAQCTGIDSHAFTDLKITLKFDALRILDLTGCDGVGDDAIARIIPAAPRLRNLVLAKCRNITDQAVRAICTLTKNLHYIHLGHCQLLTDNAVIELVQQCNRIRYIDLACCSRLTDASVKYLAKLPKLRRVGLVKCQNLTDASIIALARGPYGAGSSKSGAATHFVSLERVHLSYCTSLTLKGITQLLLNCPRLTHLSLTGVQAFLRDDLTRFCREAPPEFTHVQRDVFCVFSGEGVERLRDYLARLALEQQERDQEQQNNIGAIDEQVVGPDSPDADSLSEGTIDGADPQQLDTILGPGRHGQPRTSGTRGRPRPRSFHDLPHPNFHIDMPFLPHDQMQRIGPWTPGAPNLTPEMTPQLTPQNSRLLGPDQFTQHTIQAHETARVSSPRPSLGPFISDTYQSRSRSQSRRHTMEATDSFFDHRPWSSLAPQPPTVSRQSNGSAQTMQPNSQTSFRDIGQSDDHSLQARDGISLRPDHDVSSFEVNHEAILSTIPNSRGPSRGPSRSNSPHLLRVNSRSRFSSLLGATRGLPTPPTTAERTSQAARSREASGSRFNPSSYQNRSDRDGDAQRRSEAQVGSSSTFRSLPQLLQPDLIDQIVPSPSGLFTSPGPHPQSRGRNTGRSSAREDVNMTQ